MKILFITGFCGDNWSAPVNVAWRHISWGLLQLCPYLKQRGHSVFLFHPEVSLWRHRGNLEAVLDEFRGELRRIKPEILGVNAISTMIEEVILFAKTAKQVSQSENIPLKVIGGGPHFSTEPELALSLLPDFDAVFSGESEISLARYLDGDNPQDISGCYTRGTFKALPDKPDIIMDLDSLPLPDYQVFSGIEYFLEPRKISLHTDHPISSLDFYTSRGCKYNCAFCCFSQIKMRVYSVEWVMNYFLKMMKDYNVHTFYNIDSTLGNSEEYIHQFCEALIRTGLNHRLTLCASLRVDLANDGVLSLMKRAGFRKITFGFESGSDRILKRMRKGTTVDQGKRALALCRKHNLLVHGSFIVGYIGETITDAEATLHFMEDAGCNLASINKYVCLVGSADYMRLRGEGKIKIEKVEDYAPYSSFRSQLKWHDMDDAQFNKVFNKMCAIQRQSLAPMLPRLYAIQDRVYSRVSNILAGVKR